MERAMGILAMAEAREAGMDPNQAMMAALGGGGTTTFLDDLDEFATELMNKDPKAAFKALFNRPNQKLWKWIQSYRDELSLLKTWQIGIEASRSIEKDRDYQPTLQNLAAQIEGTDSEDVLGIFDSPSGWVFKPLTKLASARIAQQFAIMVCALRRFKIENGNYPVEPKSLTPKFLRSIPLDPIDRKPIRYRLNADGSFLLYSIGTDGIDDEGDPTRINSATGQITIRPAYPALAKDFVWPQIATDEEILEWERKESGEAE